MLPLLLRLVIAVATVIASAGVASFERGSTSLVVTTFHVVTAASAGSVSIPSPWGSEPDAASSEPSHRWHESTEPVADLEAIEADDDEDDPLRDVLGIAALPLECVPIRREVDRDPGNELPSDTSRFAAGTGLPRGPPV